MKEQPAHLKYQVDQPHKLSSWTAIAKWEITKWLCDDEFKERIIRDVMRMESMGPFTKFLYHFAGECRAGWGVMIDFNEYSQRVFLPDHYYKWMHKLRDEVLIDIETNKHNDTVRICASCETEWKDDFWCKCSPSLCLNCCPNAYAMAKCCAEKCEPYHY